jgi:mannosyltransferase OCH1-like enzyme
MARTKLSGELTKIENASLAYDPEPVRRIWVMWWQGVNNAPALVKKCVNILKQKSPDYEVTFLDKDNYHEYVQIPMYITDKFNGGGISIANYSDVIRMALLYQYGGYWIDSTVLCLMVGIRTIPIYHISPLRII